MTLGAEQLAPAGRRATLEAFARALKREVHVFLERPHLLWQQLYNRLQWEEEPVPQLLAPELAHRSTPGATAWLRTRTPFRESGALVRTLVADDWSFADCVISPDGSFIVSASWQTTLKIWDGASQYEDGSSGVGRLAKSLP